MWQIKDLDSRLDGDNNTVDNRISFSLQISALSLTPGGRFITPAFRSSYDVINGDVIADLENQFLDLSLHPNFDNRKIINKKPPNSYLCHLCFQKGHFIKDCPQVRSVNQCLGK